MSRSKSVRLLAYLAAATLSAGCATGPQHGPAAEAQRAANISKARQDLDHAEARVQLEALRQAADEKRWAAVEGLARSLFDSGYFEGEAGYLLGKALFERRKFFESLQVWREVRDIAADKIPEHEYLDVLLASLDDIPRDETDLRVEVRLEIARRAPRHSLGSSEAIRGELIEAISGLYHDREWEEVLAASEMLLANDAGAAEESGRRLRNLSYMRGVALWHIGRRAEARDALERYIGEFGQDNYADRVDTVADFYFDQGEDQLGLEFYERGLGQVSRQPTKARVNLYYDLAKRFLASKDAASVEKGKAYLHYYVRYALHIYPEGRADNIYRSASRLARRYGHGQLASDLAQEALSLGHASRYQYRDLFEDRLRQGDKKKAREVLEAYIAKRDSSARSKWRVSKWARRANQLDWAEAYLKAALDEQPDDPDWWYDLAQLATQKGDDKQMVRAIRRFIKLQRGRDWAVRSAARLYERAGMNDEAVKLLGDFFEEEPGNARMAMRLARLLDESGRTERAKKLLRDAVDAPGMSRYEVSDLANFVRRRWGKKDAYPYYIKSAEKGRERDYLEAAEIALEFGQRAKFDDAISRYLKTTGADFRALERVWYLIRRSGDEAQKIALLEKILDSGRRRGKREYRFILTNLYLDRDEDAKAFALWDQKLSSNRVDFDTLYRSHKRLPRWPRLIAQFRKNYPDDRAPASLLFFVSELYYWWGKHGATNQWPADAPNAQAALERARALHDRIAERASPESSDLIQAASLYESRGYEDLIERTYWRYLQANPDSEDGWVRYGNYLIDQGRYAAAVHVMLQFVRHSRRHGEALVGVAARFKEVGKLDIAETFYRKALAYREDNELTKYRHREILEDVGVGLGQMYLNNGRVDDFLELTADYYSKHLGNHPYLRQHDRNIDLEGLRERGLWAPYLKRLEKLEEVNVDGRHSDELPRTLWFLGRSDEAWRAFETSIERAADSDADRSYHWRRTAEFLQERGGEKLAATAWDRAVRYASGHNQYQVLLERARFLAMQGHVDAALADYEAAANVLRRPKRVYSTMMAVLESVGAGESGRALKEREGSVFESVEEDTKRRLGELERGTTDELVERARKMAAKGVRWRRIGRELDRHGHHEALARLTKELIAKSDFQQAARLASRYRSSLAAVDALAPVVEKLSSHRNSIEIRDFDEFLIQSFLDLERPEAALEVWRRARERVPSRLVAQLLIASGQERDLSRHVFEWIDKYSRLRRGYRVSPLISLTRLGKGELGSRILDRWYRQNTDNEKLADSYIADLLRRGGAGRALGFLEHVAHQATMMQGGGGNHGRIEVVTIGLAVIASSGYSAEARAFVEQLPASIRSNGEVRQLAQRLELLVGDDAPRSADAQDKRSWREIRRRIDLYLMAGEYEAAETLASGVLRELRGEEAGFELSFGPNSHYYAEIGEVLLAIYRASGREDKVDEVIAMWNEKVGVGPGDTQSLVRQLASRGFYAHAARVARRGAERFPTGKALAYAISRAAWIGDRDTVVELLPAYWRIQGSSGRELGDRDVYRLVRRHSPSGVEPILERHRRTRPARIEHEVSQIVLAYRRGEFERARKLARAYVEANEGQPTSIELLMSRLNRSEFYVETLRVVAPLVEASALSENALEETLEAAIKLEVDDEIIPYVDAWLQAEGVAGRNLADIALELASRGMAEPALSLAERAMEAGHDHSLNYLARGVARLQLGIGGAEEDIERGTSSRRGDVEKLGLVAKAALRAGRPGLAEKYLVAILAAPHGGRHRRDHPIGVIIEVFEETGEQRRGVAFLDRHVAGVLEDPYATGRGSWALQIGQLLSDAGMLERADRWYRRAGDYWMLAGNDDKVDDILVARAKNLAINGGDPAVALDLAQRAMALGRSRSGEDIYAYALALYRSGRVDEAVDALGEAVKMGFENSSIHAGYRQHLDEAVGAQLER